MTRYTTIIIPIEVKNKIEKLSEKKGGIALWKVINDALTFYEHLEKSKTAKRKISNIDKIAWYIYKFTKSISIFLELPSEENYGKVIERIEVDLKERVFKQNLDDLEILKKLVSQYLIEKSTRLKIQINDLARTIISKMILTLIEETSTSSNSSQS